VKKVGQDGGGDFHGELEQGGAPAGQGSDTEVAQAFAEPGGGDRTAR